MITVNLLDPGQFFACCGLLEFASLRYGAAEARFVGEDRFELRGCAVADVLGLVQQTECRPLSWCPKSKKTFELVVCGALLPITWMDQDICMGARMAPVSGAQALLKQQEKVLAIVRQPRFHSEAAIKAPFTVSDVAESPNKWSCLNRGVAQDVGVSGNGKPSYYFPWISFLAPIGLQRFLRDFPVGGDAAYYAWQDWLPVIPAVAASHGAPGAIGFCFKKFYATVDRTEYGHPHAARRIA